MAIAFIFTTISFCQLKFREKKNVRYMNLSYQSEDFTSWKLVGITFWISKFVEMFAQSQL